jgi:sugar phosphate isomerase/epimerase
MKLAFTTLGCPSWDVDTIVLKAVEYGFDGVDFRGYLGKLELYELPQFTTGLQSTARKFADAGLEVPCFSSSVHLFSKTREKLDAAIQEVKSYAEICRVFGAQFIRVFGGSIRETPREQAIDILVDNLASLVTAVQEYGIQLLVETHDDWVDSHHLRPVMERVNSDSVGILWDTHHPYRMSGVTPEKTWEELGRWIRNTHWKDSRIDLDNKRGYQLCLVGNGDIPLKDIFACLKRNGYDGYLTLEWEKMWAPEIEEPDVAFPAYVHYMRNLMETV